MRLVSVNIARAESVAHGSRSITTGIRKRPASAPIRITRLGLEGDAICNTEHHGGVDQAVYVYSGEDYDWWSRQLGRELAPGTFGDNLTVRGLPSNMNVGDRLLIGDVVLEATAPRIPCSTLAAQMQDSTFGMAFRRAERPGIYFRVLNEGTVEAGDAVMLVENPVVIVSILDLFRLAYELRPDAETVRRYLDAPLAERMRANLLEKLVKSEA